MTCLSIPNPVQTIWFHLLHFIPRLVQPKLSAVSLRSCSLGSEVVALWLPCFLKTSVLAGTLCIVSSLQRWRNHTSLPMCVSITVCSVRKASLMSSLNPFSQQFELFFLISMLWTRSILFSSQRPFKSEEFLFFITL